MSPKYKLMFYSIFLTIILVIPLTIYFSIPSPLSDWQKYKNHINYLEKISSSITEGLIDEENNDDMYIQYSTNEFIDLLNTGAIEDKYIDLTNVDTNVFLYTKDTLVIKSSRIKASSNTFINLISSEINLILENSYVELTFVPYQSINIDLSVKNSNIWMNVDKNMYVDYYIEWSPEIIGMDSIVNGWYENEMKNIKYSYKKY